VSYKPRDESPGYHHVVTRGNNKRVTYECDRDRQYFCLLVEHVAEKYGWSVIAWCLMKNHYHLIVRIGDAGLSDGMCELNTGYATWFNIEHGRVNHLFGKRYWNRRLVSEGALMNAIRYIVRNPVAAGGKEPLEGYAWTSYSATIGLAVSRIPLELDHLFAILAPTPEAAVARLRAFCSQPVPRGHDRWQPP
jgi:putative transposase